MTRKAKIIIVIGAVIILLGFLLGFLLVLLANHFPLFYTERGEIDGFRVHVNRVGNQCFVGRYTYDGENREITIPDEYDGVPITRIGGSSAINGPLNEFYVDMRDVYMNSEESPYHTVYTESVMDDEHIRDPYTIEEVPFVLHIGKNIRTVERVDMDKYYPHVNEDGSITFYHAVFEIRCDEDNPYFYAKDGKLYGRKTDQPVSEFHAE